MGDGVVRGDHGGSRDVELVVVPDAGAAAAAVAALLAEAVEAGGSDRAGRRLHSPQGVRARGHARRGLGWRRSLVRRRPLRARGRSALQPAARARALLDRIIVHPTVHAIATDLPANEAAAAYDAELRDEPLDLVLLGLGADGHTASLFPEAPTLDERERLAVAAEPGLEPFVERVTLTIPALESGAHVVFLVVGEEKADAVRRAFAEAPSSLDAGEPRALAGRPDDRHSRRCCCFAPVLTPVGAGRLGVASSRGASPGQSPTRATAGSAGSVRSSRSRGRAPAPRSPRAPARSAAPAACRARRPTGRTS